MKHNLRTKFFYVTMALLLAVVAVGAQPATPAFAACFTPTTTVLVDGPASPQVYGTAITFTATVTPVAATGTVQFYDGATAIGAPIAMPAGNVVVINKSDLTVLGSPHNITAVYSGDANYCTSTSNITPRTVTPLALTVDGTQVVNPTKVYDGNTKSFFKGGALVGVLFGDDVTIATRPGTYASKDVFFAPPNNVTPAFTLGGADAGNYTLTQPAAQAALITPKPLTVTGISASNKVYDANNTATINTASAAFTIGEVIIGDAVDLINAGTVGTFADKNIGIAKVVTINGFALGGAQAGDYSLAAPTTTADITARGLTLTPDNGNLTADNKPYDGNTAATFTTGANPFVGLQGGEVGVTLAGVGTFADANVGTAITVTPGVFGLAGADSGNYTLDEQPVGPYTANITGPVNLAAITLNNPTQVYNGSPFAADLTPTLAGGFVVPGTFSVLYNGSAVVPTNAGVYALTGTFTPSNIGNVNASAINAFGAINMTITKANILPADVAILNDPATWTGSPIAADLDAGVPGVFSSVTYDGSTTVPTAVGTYYVRAIFTPTDAANYNGFGYSGIGFYHIVAVTPPTRTEMLQNGGFNEYGYADQFSLTQLFIPDGWFDSNYAETDGRNSDAYEGAFSVAVHGEKGANRSKSLFQNFNVAGSAGDRVTLRFMAKSSANLADGGFCLAYVTLYNAGSAVGARRINCGNVGTSWEAVHFSLAAPADFTSAKVRFFFNKPVGTIWFDSASLIWSR